jgi:hypothetical protein
MSKTKIDWAKAPPAEDIDAAGSYLSLLFPQAQCKSLLRGLRDAVAIVHASKDLLRAANLPLLPRDDPHVDEDLKRIHKGKSFSPVLLVCGDGSRGLPLIVADGYHRICVLCYVDESEPAVCRMAGR